MKQLFKGDTRHVNRLSAVRSFSVTGAICQGYHRGDSLGFSESRFTPSDDLVGENGAWDDGPAGYEWKRRLLTERRGMALDYLTDVKKRVPIHNAVRIRARLNRERLMNDINGGAGAAAGGGGDSLSGNYSRVIHRPGGAYDADGIPLTDLEAGDRPRGTLGLELNLNSPSAVLTEALRVSNYNPALDADAPLSSDTAARLAIAAERDPITKALLSPNPSNSASTITGSSGHAQVRDAIDIVEEELEDFLADEGTLETLANISPEDLNELRHEFYGGAPEVSSVHGASLDDTLRNWLRIRKDSSVYHSYQSVPTDERKDWSAFYLRDIQAAKESEDD